MSQFLPPLPPETVKAIRKAKWAGASLFDISCEFDVCKATAHRYTADIPVKAKAGQPPAYDREKVLKLLGQGLSPTIIRERLGISRVQVFRICKQHYGCTPSELIHSRYNEQKAAA
jgi:hypothetical protein